ncbi:MAG TPA: glutamyl-tRNA reductase [Kofleriaceae bacterium]|nr:glutamyl-tRNA reductase [Kofleriaceae bacterium]
MASAGGSGELFVVGLSWRTAPVAVRERLAFRDEEVAPALADLLGSPDIDEAVILSTCNRVEIYGSTPPAQPGGSAVVAAAVARSFLARSRGVAAEGLADHLYERVDVDAIRHLFRVAAALDSMVVGESQILGQLKGAYGAAARVQATGAVLGRSMEKAFQVAKRVRSETGISRGAANVSSVAVELARRVFGDLDGKTILVIGAGKMSALAARHLRVAGARSILVTNRSPEKAAELAAEVEGTARPWAELPALLAEADVVLSSTGATQPILDPKLMKGAMKARRWRPLVVVDIAVPRDADPAIGKLDGVYLFDIDDLERVVSENLKERQKEADAALSIVEVEVTELRRWLRAQRVVPTIRSLREHFHHVAMGEAERCITGLGPQASAADVEKAIRRMSELIANKLLHTPLSALKATEQDLDTMVQVTQRLFALTDAPEPAPAAAPEPLIQGKKG